MLLRPPCTPAHCMHTGIHLCTRRLLINYKSFICIRATCVVDDHLLDHRNRIPLIITCLAGKSQLGKNPQTDENNVPQIMTLCQIARQSQVGFSYIKMSIWVSFISFMTAVSFGIYIFYAENSLWSSCDGVRLKITKENFPTSLTVQYHWQNNRKRSRLLLNCFIAQIWGVSIRCIRFES